MRGLVKAVLALVAATLAALVGGDAEDADADAAATPVTVAAGENLNHDPILADQVVVVGGQTTEVDAHLDP